MRFVLPAGIGFAINGLPVDEPHEPSYAISAQVIALRFKPGFQASAAIKRSLKALFVHQAHDIKVSLGFRNRSVIQPAAMNTDQFTLADYADVFVLLYHRSAFS